jgi:alpha-beta hydrolase superfamily lysophospholipase
MIVDAAAQPFPRHPLLVPMAPLRTIGPLRSAIHHPKICRAVSPIILCTTTSDHPAYPDFPAHILSQVNHLSHAMLSALPGVSAPALLIHSRADQAVPFSCLKNIYDHISSSYKEMLPLDGMDHSLVRDPQHQVVFDAILNFLSRL